MTENLKTGYMRGTESFSVAKDTYMPVHLKKGHSPDVVPSSTRKGVFTWEMYVVGGLTAKASIWILKAVANPRECSKMANS